MPLLPSTRLPLTAADAEAVGCRLLHCAEGSLHGDAGDVSALSLDPATSCLVTGSKEGIRVWKAGVA